jgi:hypothetical protein
LILWRIAEEDSSCCRYLAKVIDAFPRDAAPHWLLRDRDAIYGDACHEAAAEA